MREEHGRAAGMMDRRGTEETEECSMTVSQILEKMITFASGNLHDIDHFLRVWAYARTIGKLEGISEETQYILEVAAITHDIACPLCREKYGSTKAEYQEAEGMPMVEAFLDDTGMSRDQIERVRYLVGHHHTLSGIDGIDYQILVEADFIVNASEKGYSEQNIRNFLDRIARTEAGERLIRSVFRL